MKPWLLTVAVLFVLAKAILWAKSFILPLPIYVLAGAFLAIASNYDHGMSGLFQLATLGNNNFASTTEEDVIVQTASLVEDVPALEAKEQ